MPVIDPSHTTLLTLEELELTAEDSEDPDGSIVNYSWDFGDGETGFGKEVSHQWADDGNYTVTLNVTDDDGEVNMTAASVDVLNRIPDVELTAGGDTGNRSTLFTFTANGTDMDGDVVAYHWDFGDGDDAVQEVSPAAASSSPVSHTFASVGQFTVTVSARDDDGGMSSEEQVTLTVENLAPTARASSDQSSILTGLSVSFDSTGSADPDGDSLNYSWSIATAGMKVPIHTSESDSFGFTFDDDGNYSVFLTVTDIHDAEDTHIIWVEVINRPPVADLVVMKDGTVLTSPAKVLVNETLTFDAAGSSDPDGVIVGHYWKFGGGSTATGVSSEHAWTEPGTYEVNLTVADEDGGTDAVRFTVEVSSVDEGPGDGPGGEGGGGKDTSSSGETDMMPILILVIVTTAVAVVAAILIARRKKGQPTDEEDGGEMGPLGTMEAMEPMGTMEAMEPMEPLDGPVPVAVAAGSPHGGAGAYAAEDGGATDYGSDGPLPAPEAPQALPPAAPASEVPTGEETPVEEPSGEPIAAEEPVQAATAPVPAAEPVAEAPAPPGDVGTLPDED
jgi:PKD repeat protein